MEQKINSLDLDKIIELIKEIKNSNFPVKSLIIDWKNFQVLTKLETGATRMIDEIKPCIKVEYETQN